jgi:hypothetical protein
MLQEEEVAVVDADLAEGLLFLATHCFDLGNVQAAEQCCLK